MQMNLYAPFCRDLPIPKSNILQVINFFFLHLIFFLFLINFVGNGLLNLGVALLAEEVFVCLFVLKVV